MLQEIGIYVDTHQPVKPRSRIRDFIFRQLVRNGLRRHLTNCFDRVALMRLLRTDTLTFVFLERGPLSIQISYSPNKKSSVSVIAQIHIRLTILSTRPRSARQTVQLKPKHTGHFHTAHTTKGSTCACLVSILRSVCAS